MNQNQFDKILKKNVINATDINPFEPIGYKKPYPAYYKDPIFLDFVHEMQTEFPKHFEKYNRGKGNELTPQNGSPAKMASVGSSSRFCYLALRHYGDAVDFEHECRIKGIKGGTAPQMDAYFKDSNTFVEVKCHEIFGSHDTQLSKQYIPLLFGKGNDFGLPVIEPEVVNGKFEIPFKEMGITPPKMFDVKQLLCHLLGVKSHNEADDRQDKKAPRLVYLFFKPKASTQEEQDAIDEAFKTLSGEIHDIFYKDESCIKKFAQKNGIELIAIAEHAEVMGPLTDTNRIRL